MEKKTIGDKKVFAIEYEITKVNPFLGKVCLWINNIYIGYFEEETYLYFIEKALEFIKSKSGTLGSQEFQNKNDGEIFEVLLNSEDVKYDKYYFSIGETFDEFIIKVIEIDDNYKIFWQLRKDHWNEHQNYSLEVHSGLIPKSYFDYILEEYKKIRYYCLGTN